MKKRTAKRLLGLLMAVLMVASLAIPASAARTFSDVRGTDWYYKAVEYAAAKTYMKGPGNGGFNPGGMVIRSEVTQVLYNKAGKPAPTTSNSFSDVDSNGWYADAITWCREKNIISDALVSGSSFGPMNTITRQDVCVMAYNYMMATTNSSPDFASDEEMAKFSDTDKISGYAQGPVAWAVVSGFMNGKQNGSDYQVDPQGSVTRVELAQFLMNLDAVLGLDTSFTPPADDAPAFEAPVGISQNAGGVYVQGVSFNPEKGYKAQYVLANDRLFSAEGWSSIVNRTGAYIAFNGAFFQSGSDLETDAMMINNGSVMRIDNDGTPGKSTFVIDKNGKASIQHMSIEQTFRVFRDGVDVTPDYQGGITALLNSKLPVDDPWGTRMVQTGLFGNAVPGRAAYAAAVDGNGVVVAKYQGESDIPVPNGGYVLYQRKKMNEEFDNFISDEVQVGDTIQRSFQYVGSTTQDIQMAFSCGPTVVRDGAAYGNNQTYIDESFGTIKRGSLARMAIGVKADGTVVVINATCDVPALSSAMLALGCTDAFNLDGGGSTFLRVNGNNIASPGRNLSNVVVFTKA